VPNDGPLAAGEFGAAGAAAVVGAESERDMHDYPRPAVRHPTPQVAIR
jgi:hypothetical protein